MTADGPDEYDSEKLMSPIPAGVLSLVVNKQRIVIKSLMMAIVALTNGDQSMARSLIGEARAQDGELGDLLDHFAGYIGSGRHHDG